MNSYNSVYTAMSQGLLPGPLPTTAAFWSGKLQTNLISPSADIPAPATMVSHVNKGKSNETVKRGFSIADILSDERASQQVELRKSVASTTNNTSNSIASGSSKDNSRQLMDLSQYLAATSVPQYGVMSTSQSHLSLPVTLPYLPTAAVAAVNHHLQQHGVVPTPVSGMRQCRNKRVRTIFTPEQLEQLEKIFQKQQYMVGTERYYLASKLCLSEAQVKVWFQNRRIKWRKQLGLERRVTGDGRGGVHSCSSDYSDDTCSESGFSDTGSV